MIDTIRQISIVCLLTLLAISNVSAHVQELHGARPDELTTLTSPDTGVTRYQYDADGNLTTQTSGCVVKTFRIEHVWVEAYVNYNPSRGTKTGPGDTWPPFLEMEFFQ